MEAKLRILLLNNLVKKNLHFLLHREISDKNRKSLISVLFFYHFIIDYFRKPMAPSGGTYFCSSRK